MRNVPYYVQLFFNSSRNDAGDSHFVGEVNCLSVLCSLTVSVFRVRESCNLIKFRFDVMIQFASITPAVSLRDLFSLEAADRALQLGIALREGGLRFAINSNLL